MIVFLTPWSRPHFSISLIVGSLGLRLQDPLPRTSDGGLLSRDAPWPAHRKDQRHQRSRQNLFYKTHIRLISRDLPVSRSHSIRPQRSDVRDQTSKVSSQRFPNSHFAIRNSHSAILALCSSLPRSQTSEVRSQTFRIPQFAIRNSPSSPTLPPSLHHGLSERKIFPTNNPTEHTPA